MGNSERHGGCGGFSPRPPWSPAVLQAELVSTMSCRIASPAQVE